MLTKGISAGMCVLFLAGVAWGYNAQELLEQLNNTTGQRQLEAAWRMGDFDYPEVVTALAAKLDDPQTDVTVRAACATSLGKLNKESTYPQIEALAKKPDEKSLVRSSCVKAMAAMKQAEVIDEFLEMIKIEKSVLVKKTIEETLGGMKDKPRVAAAVTSLLNDESAAPSAIRVLGQVGGPAVIPPLAKQLDSSRASIRQAVIKALGSIIYPDAVTPLIQYYPKGNDAEKGQILAAFARHPHPAALELLVNELANPKTYPALRRRSALTLGTLRARPAIDPMVKIMLNTAEHAGLRLTCAQALGNFGDHDDTAIVGLIGALADKRLADTAAISLGRITKHYLGTDKKNWEQWFQKWRVERDRYERLGH